MELMGPSRNDDTNDLYSQIELPFFREAISKLELLAGAASSQKRKGTMGETTELRQSEFSA